MTKVTPMMSQWQACKEQVPGAVLLFRLGDFYEAFAEDAELVAKELDLTLTRRQEIPMAGVPAHAADSYIDRLVDRGHRVAVADQTEDASQAKGLVKREIVRVITPGTVISSSMLPERQNNYFAALVQNGKLFGLALIDIGTAEFWVLERNSFKELALEILRFLPKEILCPKALGEHVDALRQEPSNSWNPTLHLLENWEFSHEIACATLMNHLRVHSLDGFGLKGMIPAINTAGVLLQYLKDQLHQTLDHIRAIHPLPSGEWMSIDPSTQSHLDLVKSSSNQPTLLSVIDHTCTPMGARQLRGWLLRPLLNLEKIQQRLDAVEGLLQQVTPIREALAPIRDLERLTTKVAANLASPRDLVALKLSLQAIPQLRASCLALQSPLLQAITANLMPIEELANLLQRALVEDPPARVVDGGLFAKGYSQELDDLSALSTNAKGWLAQYEEKVKAETGIRHLRVGYNRTFGYYIEVSRSQTALVPRDFIRKQTLSNAERYISPLLQEHEEKILSCKERVHALESALWSGLREEVGAYTDQIMALAKAVSHLDVLQSLAHAAKRQGYCKPTLDTSQTLSISAGRHSMVEAHHLGQHFVPNDTALGGGEGVVHILTGPNMAGKSTYIRQVALIVILAQMGSFVPAHAAHIGLVDKLFTRIGANDDLSRGQSTFMVEMTETANILHNATPRSLIILDEIGRGTSTYDGISIAWAVAEDLATSLLRTPRTLFATHYFELTELANVWDSVKNYHVAVQEVDGQILFLRKICPGAADKSYGIQVADLAGLPKSVVQRAKKMLSQLEQRKRKPKRQKEAVKGQQLQEEQLDLFSLSGC